MKKIIACIFLTGVILCNGCAEKKENADNISSSVDSVSESQSVTDTGNEESEPVPDNSLSTDALCNVVIDGADFPLMLKVDIPEKLELIMDFSKYGIEEYTVYQPSMSVHICEVIIIRTEDVKATTEALEERKDVLINQLAFYPEQQEAANNTVVGSKNNVCYLIAHKDASTAEKALLQKI